MSVDGNDIAIYSLLIGLGGVIVAAAGMRRGSSQRRVDRQEKDLKEMIDLALTSYKIELSDNLAKICITKEGVGQLKYDILEEANKRYLPRETWEQHNESEKAKFERIDETMKGYDHRIRRNSQNVYIVTDNMFDVMSYIGMRKKNRPHDDEESAHQQDT